MGKLLLVLPPGGLSGEFSERLSKDFEVLIVGSEEEGIGVIEEEEGAVSAVLIDINIARESGHLILGYLKSDMIFASIPAIAVLDRQPTEEDMDVFEMGYLDLLSPPGFSEQLKCRINNCIRSKDSFTYTEMQKMLKQLPSNIFLKDREGKYVFATQYWHHLNQDGKKWTIRGKTDIDIRKDKENARKAMEADKQILLTGKGTNYIIEEKSDGIREYLELIKRPVFDDEGNVTGIIALINNVTEMELLKMELEERSRMDPLTGLLNKGAAEDLVDILIAGDREGKDHGALMMIDLDNFKTVNDVFGHSKGDMVLSTIGRIIHNNFKGKDVAGRIGGDEFMVFLRGVETEESIVHLAEKIQYDTVHAFDGEELEGYTSLSIGISRYPEDGCSYKDLYNAADEAMYLVKKQGKGSYHIYSEP